MLKEVGEGMGLARSMDSLAPHRSQREGTRPGEGGVCTFSFEGAGKVGHQLVLWMRKGEELEFSGEKGQQETALSW